MSNDPSKKQLTVPGNDPWKQYVIAFDARSTPLLKFAKGLWLAGATPSG